MKRVLSTLCIAIGILTLWVSFSYDRGPVYANGDGHTHFRYGHYTWTPVSGTTVEFTLQNAWRRNGYGCINPTTLSSVACSAPDGLPGVGDVIAEFIGGTRFFPGDGSSPVGSPLGPLLYLVTSIDPANNWLFGLALDPVSLPAVDTTIGHTYPGPGNFTAFTDSCCRISRVAGINEHINNPDGGYRVETVVNVGTTNNSPISVLPPIILCPIDALCTFLVPGADPDGDPLSFRLSTTLEASGFGGFAQPGPPHAPNAASIDAATGLYTWDTTGATRASNPVNNTLYSTQVTIEDATSKVAVDFLIQLVAEDANPPIIEPPPDAPPVCETTQVVTVGVTKTFDVIASDPDSEDIVTLNVVGLPVGATMSPPLPIAGNPVTSSFSWTPGPGHVGVHVVTFTASSSGGGFALCPVTLTVFAVPPSLIDLSISEVKPIQVVEGVDINGDGRTDLVLGKPMVVRVRVQVTNPESIPEGEQNVRVHLIVSRGIHTEFRTVTQLMENPIIDFFVTPEELGDDAITVDIDPLNQITESDEGNNTAQVGATVKDTTGFHIAYMPVTGFGVVEDYEKTVTQNGKFFIGIYPVAPNEFVNERTSTPVTVYTQKILKGIAIDRDPVADILHLWRQGKRVSSLADYFVGVAPGGFFEARYGTEPGGFIPCVVNKITGEIIWCPPATFISDKAWDAAAHEIGHYFGFQHSSGEAATGYWVEERKQINTIDFMMPTGDFESFNRWITNEQFSHLFSRFRTQSNDPEVLLISGLVLPDGQIIEMPLYRLDEGILDEIPHGDYVLQMLNASGNVVYETNFSATNALISHTDSPITSGLGMFAFAVLYPEDVISLRISLNNEVIQDINVTAQLLHDAIDTIPDFGYVRNPNERRNALHNKIEALRLQIEAGAYVGALEKLRNDIKPSLERWLQSDYQPEEVLQYSKVEILTLVNEMIQRIELIAGQQ